MKKIKADEIIKKWLNSKQVDTTYACSIISYNDYERPYCYLEIRMGNSSVSLTEDHILELKNVVDQSVKLLGRFKKEDEEVTEEE